MARSLHARAHWHSLDAQEAELDKFFEEHKLRGTERSLLRAAWTELASAAAAGTTARTAGMCARVLVCVEWCGVCVFEVFSFYYFSFYYSVCLFLSGVCLAGFTSIWLSVGRLLGWLIGHSLVCRLVGLSVGWLVGWLVVRVCCLFVGPICLCVRSRVCVSV